MEKGQLMAGKCCNTGSWRQEPGIDQHLLKTDATDARESASSQALNISSSRSNHSLKYSRVSLIKAATWNPPITKICDSAFTFRLNKLFRWLMNCMPSFFLFQNFVDTIPLAIQSNAVDSNDRIEDRPTPSKLKFLETKVASHTIDV